MSVMLRTINPDAANEDTQDRRRPYQGQIVIFHARPGEGRIGRLEAVAIVCFVEDEDHVDILIAYDADDFIYRRKIPRKTDQNNVNCWSFNEYDQVYYEPVDMFSRPKEVEGNPLHVKLDEFDKQMKALHEIVAKIDKRTAKK